MTTDQIVTVITGVLQTGGIGTFLYFLIRGLRNRIASLKETVDVQKLTIEAMERRLIETEKVGGVWKQFASDIPEAVEAYKEVVTKLKDEMIAEQKKAIEQKDEQLQEVAQVKLKQLELFEKTITSLPALAEQLQGSIEGLEERLSQAGMLSPVVVESRPSCDIQEHLSQAIPWPGTTIPYLAPAIYAVSRKIDSGKLLALLRQAVEHAEHMRRRSGLLEPLEQTREDGELDKKGETEEPGKDEPTSPP